MDRSIANPGLVGAGLRGMLNVASGPLKNVAKIANVFRSAKERIYRKDKKYEPFDKEMGAFRKAKDAGNLDTGQTIDLLKGNKKIRDSIESGNILQSSTNKLEPPSKRGGKKRIEGRIGGQSPDITKSNNPGNNKKTRYQKWLDSQKQL